LLNALNSASDLADIASGTNQYHDEPIPRRTNTTTNQDTTNHGVRRTMIEKNTWDRADLLCRVQIALDVALRALETAERDTSFATASGNWKSDREDCDGSRSGIQPLVLAKVVAESAMLLQCTAFLADIDARIATTVNELAYRLVPLARNDVIRVGLCREPAFALDHVAAHIHLRDLGFGDDGFDRFLLDVLQDGNAGGPERLPNHDLEHDWLMHLLRDDHSAISTDLLSRTCLARPLDSLGASVWDLYVFSHTTLYATDMGRRQVIWPRPVTNIASDAVAALGLALDSENYDLAAELLWIWPMLQLPWNAAAAFCFAVVAEVQDRFGFLPGPGFSATDFWRFREDKRDDYMLRTSYHATLVMGITCGVALRQDLPPNDLPEVVADDLNVVAIGELLSTITRGERKPSWLVAFRNLEPSSQLPLSEFLVSIALRRARTANDIELLRQILSISVRTGLTDCPASYQAAALLRRSKHLSAMT
jgi:hypothetical protein